MTVDPGDFFSSVKMPGAVSAFVFGGFEWQTVMPRIWQRDGARTSQAAISFGRVKARPLRGASQP